MKVLRVIAAFIAYTTLRVIIPMIAVIAVCSAVFGVIWLWNKYIGDALFLLACIMSILILFMVLLFILGFTESKLYKWATK